MQNFGFSMLWFWSAYIIVTLIGILHTIFNIYVLHMKPMDKDSMGEGYEKTKPWHPLSNIVIFTVFGFIYMNGLSNPTITEALITGASGGIGKEMAYYLDKLNYELILVARDEKALIEVKSKCQNAKIIALDLSKIENVQKLYEETKKQVSLFFLEEIQSSDTIKIKIVM